MKSEKLLHLFWEFPPYIEGGLGVAGESLCRSLTSRIRVDIAIPRLSKTLVQDQHTKYSIFQIKSSAPETTTPSSSYASEQYIEQLESQIDEFEAGVISSHFTRYKSIHAHDWITAKAAFSVQKANQSEHIPVILHIHSTQVERVGAHSRGSIFKREQSAMKKADKIIAISHKTKNIIVNHYGITHKKVIVIHNAPPLIPFLKTRKTQQSTILFAGRLESQKSPLFASEVICKVLKNLPETKAIIAGTGSMLESVRELVKFKKLDHRIEVLGKIPHNKMHLVYESCDVLLMPSIDEPFGLVALEAAKSGLAVIMSDRCGAAEILQSSPNITLNTKDSFNAWVDTAIELLNHSQSREDLVRAQLSDLFDCNWENAAQQLLQAINDERQF